MAAVVDPSWTSVEPVATDRLAGWFSASASVQWSDDGSAQQQPSHGDTPAVRRSSSIAGWLFAIAVALATAEAVLARRFSHAVRRTAVSPQHDLPRVAAGGAPQ